MTPAPAARDALADKRRIDLPGGYYLFQRQPDHLTCSLHAADGLHIGNLRSEEAAAFADVLRTTTPTISSGDVDGAESVPDRDGADGTERLCRALYGRKATAGDYVGGSDARMLHDAADRLTAPTVSSGADRAAVRAQRSAGADADDGLVMDSEGVFRAPVELPHLDFAPDTPVADTGREANPNVARILAQHSDALDTDVIRQSDGLLFGHLRALANGGRL